MKWEEEKGWQRTEVARPESSTKTSHDRITGISHACPMATR
jgi:hypothetical protein